MRYLVRSILMVLFICGFSSSALAVCSNNEDGQPGQNGEIEYFTATDQLMYCDDTNWIAMVDPSVTCTSCGGDSSERVVFVGNGSSANMGGIAGADTNCQNSATAAGLSGTYKAWLADTDPNSAPTARFEKSGVKYVRVTGIKVADNWQDLTDGTLDASIALRANGTVTSLNALHSNVLINGAQKGNTAADSCDDWSASGVTGNRGRDDVNTSNWTDLSNVTCGSGGNRPYCFEQQATIEDRLLAHWKLDETSGSTIEDSAGIHTGTWTDSGDNDVSGESTTGQVGNALTFSGVELVEAGSAPIVDNLSAMSVCAWVYRTSSSGSWSIVLGKTSDGYDGWNLYTRRSNGVFGFYNLNRRYEQTTSTIPLNTWAHICGTTDGNTTGDAVQLYLNGSLVTGTEATAGGGVNDDSALNVTIGNINSTTFPFIGNIDDVRLYNRVISATEVADIYNGASSYSLSGHWKMDETSGTIAIDSSGNGLDGSMLGTLDGASDTTDGVIGTALSFGGLASDDEISIQDTSLDLEAFSFAVWVKTTGSDCSVADFNCPGIVRKVSGSPPNNSSDVGWYVVQRSGYVRASFHDGDGTTVRVSNTTIINDGRWHHIAVTRDSSKNNIVYVDGVAGTPGSDTYNLTSTAALRIGAELSNASGGKAWDGDIDDARYYNRALSASEIEVLASCTGPGVYFYNFTDDAMQWCDGNRAHNMGPPASGAGGCTSPAASEGALNYDTDRYKFCDGNGWVDIGK